MNFSPFSCPIFLGHPEARGRCSQGERVLYGRDLCRWGGTGKAEVAKLPGAGIGPKPCPRKCEAEKGYLTNSVRIGMKGRLGSKNSGETIRNARPRWDRHAWRGERECGRQESMLTRGRLSRQ